MTLWIGLESDGREWSSSLGYIAPYYRIFPSLPQTSPDVLSMTHSVHLLAGCAISSVSAGLLLGEVVTGFTLCEDTPRYSHDDLLI